MSDLSDDPIALSFELSERADGWWARMAEEDAEWIGPFPARDDAESHIRTFIAELYAELVQELFS